MRFLMDSQDNDETIAEAIQAYLHERPLAMDTLEGIAEWWLIHQQLHVSVAAVRRALQRLVERGVLEQIGSGKYTSYRIKRGYTNL
jgi:hypothetical protein